MAKSLIKSVINGQKGERYGRVLRPEAMQPVRLDGITATHMLAIKIKILC